MKKNILIISIGLLGFTFSLNAQNKVEKPVLASSSKTTKVQAKKIVTDKKDEQPKLKAISKKTTVVVKNTKSEPKKSNASDTPKLSTMSKKEEK